MSHTTMAEVAALADELLRLQRRRSSTVAGTVLERSVFRILWVLSDGTPRTQRDLAEALDLEQSTINRQVHAALAGGWVERYAVPGSAAKLVRPTTAGTEAFGHDGRLRGDLIAAALEALGADRARRLVDDLAAYNDAWDAARDAAHP